MRYIIEKISVKSCAAKDECHIYTAISKRFQELNSVSFVSKSKTIELIATYTRLASRTRVVSAQIHNS